MTNYQTLETEKYWNTVEARMEADEKAEKNKRAVDAFGTFLLGLVFVGVFYVGVHYFNV